jgi:hypothetical protein
MLIMRSRIINRRAGGAALAGFSGVGAVRCRCTGIDRENAEPRTLAKNI